MEHHPIVTQVRTVMNSSCDIVEYNRLCMLVCDAIRGHEWRGVLALAKPLDASTRSPECLAASQELKRIVRLAVPANQAAIPTDMYSSAKRISDLLLDIERFRRRAAGTKPTNDVSA